MRPAVLYRRFAMPSARDHFYNVMVGLVPTIHVFVFRRLKKTWMAGLSPISAKLSDPGLTLTVMARLARAIRISTDLDQMARSSRAMTKRGSRHRVRVLNFARGPSPAMRGWDFRRPAFVRGDVPRCGPATSGGASLVTNAEFDPLRRRAGCFP